MLNQSKQEIELLTQELESEKSRYELLSGDLEKSLGKTDELQKQLADFKEQSRL